MMKYFFFSTLILLSWTSLGQQLGFNYQAVAVDQSKASGFGRDSKGEVLANKQIALRFSVREESETGPIQYQETHETTTDIFGVFRLIIGRGLSNEEGKLQELNWGEIAYWLQVEIDLGDGWILMGSEELLGAPYALNTTRQTLDLNGNELSISGTNSVVLEDNDATNELITNIEIVNSELQITDAGGTKIIDLQDADIVPNITEAEVDAMVANNGYLTTEVDGSITNELQDLSLNGAQLSISEGSTVDLSALVIPSAQLTEAEVDAMVANNGYLTTEIDGSVTNEIQDISLSGTNLSITDGSTIDLSGIDTDTNTQLSETEVDAMVANNGYLTTEIDGSVTNEIQDLNLSTNTLTITGNPSATDIDLSLYENVFETTANVTSNENGDYATDDFVFGSPQLDDDGNPDHDIRFFFDKATGSVRGGRATTGEFNQATLGGLSFGFGYRPFAPGANTVAMGHAPWADGDRSVAMGDSPRAFGDVSVSIGYRTNASGEHAVSIGSNTSASGVHSVALGHENIASGYGGVAMGANVQAYSARETALGSYNTTYTPSGLGWDDSDRLLVVGNGHNEPNPSDALIILKNGNTEINGRLTLDADNDGTGYTFPGSGGTNGQILTSDGAGSLDWSDPVNQVQDLNLSTNTLSITGNPSATDIDLSPYENVFETSTNVTSNENGDYATDDFVFGSPTLDYDGNSDYEERMFFDKSNYAFRAGRTSSDEWDEVNIGSASVAFGWNNTASGNYSAAFGGFGSATGNGSLAFGSISHAIGNNSIAGGSSAEAQGAGSVALGLDSHTMAAAAVAIGDGVRAFANASNAFGRNTSSYSFAESSMGLYNTAYDPISESSFSAMDRLFVLGNGTSTDDRSDALIILKNGNTEINGRLSLDADNDGTGYTFPGSGGTNGQILTSDGSGALDWQDPVDQVQDLSFTTNTLTITGNPSATDIDLSPYQNVFETTANVTSNENGDYSGDDFVFGSPQLDDDGDPDHDARMFFDKTSGAFRVGSVEGDQWDETNIGDHSFSLGRNTIASGQVSVSLGESTIASGDRSISMGYFTTAPSYGEVAIGLLNSQYIPNSTSDYNGTDRLFVIGNGSVAGALGVFSDALVMLKNGNTTLNGELTIDGDNAGLGEPYTLPAQDGLANQIMRSDGAGNISWAAISPTGSFTTVSDIVSNSGDYSDDFVVGSPQLDDNTNPAHDARLLFDKSQGSFRVGTVEDDGWDETNRGDFSFATGIGNSAASYGETVLGTYATISPGSQNSYQVGDRLFVVGDGTSAFRSNALEIYKGGLMVVNSFQTQFHGNVDVFGMVTEISDARLKTNFQILNGSMSSLNKLNGYHFNWKKITKKDTTSLQTGFIAQEVEKLFPELVIEGTDGYKRVNYTGLIPHLVEAIKELKKENEQLRKINSIQSETYTNEMLTMSTRLEAIENWIRNQNESNIDRKIEADER